ncbi:MAG: hypothetical protein FWF29_03730 [Treponema sp.]|nr:hypothetical protein [Treponema sp.]
MKKNLCAAAGIVLASVILFFGCNRQGKVDMSDPNYPAELSVYVESGGNTQPSPTNPIYQYLKDKLHVTFKWDLLVGDARQKQGVMIASGQYPDILELMGPEWIEAGALIPLEDLIEKYGPRIKEHYKDVWDKMKSEDGHIYYLINYGVFQGVDYNPFYDQAAFWVQKAILKDAGYPKVVTLDQYFDLIADYYRRNPTIEGRPAIPFLILTYDWRGFELWSPPNFLAGNPNEGNGTVDPATYEYKTYFTQDISKRWFKKLNEINARGLLDQTSFTDNYDQYLAKIASGRVLGQSVQGWQFIWSADVANRDRGDNSRTMAPLPVVFDADIRPHYRNRPIPNLFRGIGISVSAKDPVRIIRFINDLLDENVQRTLLWGIESKEWQWGSDGVPYRNDEQRANWNNDNYHQQNRGMLMNIFPKIQGSFSDGYPSDLSHYYREREPSILPEDKELFSAYNVINTNELMDKDPPPNPPWFPTWTLTDPPDGSPAQMAIARCEQTMRQRLPQIIMADPADFDRMWDAYKAEMDKNGIAIYEQYMQEQLNKRLIDWGIRK